jgi:hypothetical protein
MAARGPMLSTSALNRALLARQGLLQPWQCGVEEALDRLVGMQSQAPNAPYVGLWSRLQSFEPDDLSTLMLRRRTVRIALMRSTLFLVTAQDCLDLRAVMQPAQDRGLAGNAGRRTTGLNLERLRAVTREYVESEPRTFAQLGAVLAREFDGCSPTDLAAVARTAVPLIQVTPRGVWGVSSAAYHTTVEQWLQAQPGTDPDPCKAIRRYLAAFGPATVADVQAWCGLIGLAPYLQRMRGDLRIFSDDRGRELFDVPDGLLPDENTVVEPRILADFDNVLLSHADRRRIFDDTIRLRFMTNNGLIRSTYLIDGFVHGVVSLTRGKAPGKAPSDAKGSTATARIEPLTRLSRADAGPLRAQAAKLLAFLAPGQQHVIEINRR